MHTNIQRQILTTLVAALLLGTLASGQAGAGRQRQGQKARRTPVTRPVQGPTVGPWVTSKAPNRRLQVVISPPSTSVGGVGNTGGWSPLTGTAGFRSDDFQSCPDIAGQWKFTDAPTGDCSAALEGAGTAEALLRIDLPAGVEHQAYNSLDAPYLSQKVKNEDFELEAKFITRPQAAFTIQGLLALEDSDNWIRFDTYGTGSSTRWFVGATVGGTTMQVGDGPLPALADPNWLQVVRVGDQWTLRYSTDGSLFSDLVSFNFVLNLKRMGPYAGNGSGASTPAYTCLVDYVFAVANPVIPEDGITPTSYTLDVSVPTGGGTVDVNPNQPTYSCGDVITLTPLPDMGMQFDGWGLDASGNDNPLDFVISADTDISAAFSLISTGPVISNLAVSPGLDTATVTWDTDVPATSRVDFGTSVAYGSFEEELTLVLSHSVSLTGLSVSTLYHYQVTSVDGAADSTSSLDQTFTTLDPPPPVLVSDDFNEANLDQGLWTFTDPGGLADLRLSGSGTSDAHLELEVPAGADYTAYGINRGARISQPVPDGDLHFIVRFDSEVATVNGSTGVFVEADDDDWVRFDFYYDGADLNLFSASFTGGVAGDLSTTVLQSGPWLAPTPLYLRITRTGNFWAADYSFDGMNFTPGTSFSQPLAVQRAGIFCGNDQVNPLQHLVVADWFFDGSAPIVPEDPIPGPDTLAPYAYTISSTVLGPNAAEVRWRTDELSTGVVAYGLDTSYTEGSVASAVLAYEHTALLVGLTAGSTYHFKVDLQDGAGNLGATPDATFDTTGAPAPGEPAVEFWYGDADQVTGTNVQRFGFLGQAQAQFNVMGNITDSDEDRVALTVTLQYSLNGRPFENAALGDDRTIDYEPWRLANEGDFNIELVPGELINVPLVNGVYRNTLELVATDDDGNATSRACFVDYTPSVTWESDPNVVWSDVDLNHGGDITEVLQVVDGIWNVETVPGLGTVLRTQTNQLGYDRIVALGEALGANGWDDYEVLVPMTAIALDPQGFTTGTASHAMGVILRWDGHTANGPFPQPKHGIYPLGGIWVYRWYPNQERWELWINENQQIIPQQANNINLGATYWYRFRCEGQLNGGTFYAMKVWLDGNAEPGPWTFTHTTNPGDPATGSFAFFAHHVDMAVGDIQITQLP
ncbi:MAG: hypothetical protein ACI8QC_001131 [Planctomycetota bacterium]|jgi:hypothetical protein